MHSPAKQIESHPRTKNTLYTSSKRSKVATETWTRTMRWARIIQPGRIPSPSSRSRSESSDAGGSSRSCIDVAESKPSFSATTSLADVSAKSRLMCISDVHKPSSAALRASVPQRFRGRMIRYRDADGGTRILRKVQAVLLLRAADVSRNLHMPNKQLSSRTSAVGFRYPMATGQFKSRRYSEPPSSCVRHELHSLHRSARTPRAVRPGEMALSAATRIQCVRL